MRTCRICLDDEEDSGEFISPCLCKGSGRWIHRECLKLCMEKALQFHHCTVCNFEYEFAYNGNRVLDYINVLVRSVFYVTLTIVAIIVVTFVIPMVLYWMVLSMFYEEGDTIKTITLTLYVAFILVGVKLTHHFCRYSRMFCLMFSCMITFDMLWDLQDWWRVPNRMSLIGFIGMCGIVIYIITNMAKHGYSLVYAKIIVKKMEVVDKNIDE